MPPQADQIRKSPLCMAFVLARTVVPWAAFFTLGAVTVKRELAVAVATKAFEWRKKEGLRRSYAARWGPLRDAPRVSPPTFLRSLVR